MRFSLLAKLAGLTLLASSVAGQAAQPEQRAADLAAAGQATAMATVVRVAAEARATRHSTTTKKKKKHATTTKKRKTTSSKKHKTSTKKHASTKTTTTTAKPTSTKVPRPAHVGKPGQQACRSGTYDFRKIKRSAFVEYGDEVNTPKGQAADWINLTGVKSAYALTERGLEISLLGPQNPIRTYSSAIQSTFVIQPGTKVTFNFKGVAAKGIATSACMYDGPGSNEIDIEFPTGLYETNIFRKVSGQDWVVNAPGSMFHSNTIQRSQLSDRVHAHSFIWTRNYVQFAMDNVVTNTRLRKDFASGFPDADTGLSPLNFGIWEPKEAGTIYWANGPADWQNLPANMTAIFESIEVDCNYTAPDAMP